MGLWLHLRSLEKRGPLQSGEPRAQSGVSSVVAPGSGLELPRSGGREMVVARRLRGVSREVGQPVGRGTSTWDPGCSQTSPNPRGAPPYQVPEAPWPVCTWQADVRGLGTAVLLWAVLQHILEGRGSSPCKDVVSAPHSPYPQTP